MGQVSAVLRKVAGGFLHWCPGCKEVHAIIVHRDPAFPGPCWTFDGNVDRPTFAPSIRITGKQAVKNDRGEWTGEWICGPDGKALDECCHYFVRAGQIEFCGDSTHALVGKTVPMPPLPAHLQDGGG